MSEQRWTIRVCAWCDTPLDAHVDGPTVGGLPSKVCESAPRGFSYALVGERTVRVVPASVLDEERARVRELEDALREIEQSPGTGGLNARRARAVLASSSAPGYANHVGASGVLGEGPHNSDATHITCPRCEGRRYVSGLAYPCDRCSASGRVPTNHDPEGGDDE